MPKIRTNAPTNIAAVADPSRLESYSNNGGRMLFKAHTKAWFDLFPNSIEINERALGITYNYFIASKQVFPVLIEDLVSVKVSTSLFFATLSFELIDYKGNPRPLRFLSKPEALRAQKMITGLMFCRRENIDTSQMELGELTTKLLEVGINNNDF